MYLFFTIKKCCLKGHVELGGLSCGGDKQQGNTEQGSKVVIHLVVGEERQDPGVHAFSQKCCFENEDDEGSEGCNVSILSRFVYNDK